VPGRCLLRVIPLAAAMPVALAVAPAALGGEIEVTLSPPYTEGVTGANGWYRVPVLATYRCDPAGNEVALSCPAAETFGDGTGAAPPVPDDDGDDDGDDDDDEGPVASDIIRTATFVRRTGRLTTESVRVVPPRGGELRIDTVPPPAPVIAQPRPPVGAAELVVAPGTRILAAYECSFDGDISGPAPRDACTAGVPNGRPIDTGSPDAPETWGPRTLTVVARDRAGNTSSATVTYRVAVDAPSLRAEPAPVPAVASPDALPATRNARVLRPSPGRTVRGAAVLRWPRGGGAGLYNVQVFRVVPGGYQKLLSAFPRENRLRIPAARMRPGARYVWRVWPYITRLGAYSRSPAGVSWFSTARR